MFDNIKNLEEESSKSKPQPNEAKTAENKKTFEVQAQDYDLPALFKTLKEEEKSLLQEQADLIVVEEELTKRIKAEITAKQQKIDELKGEIPGLKQRNEFLANVLGKPVEK